MDGTETYLDEATQTIEKGDSSVARDAIKEGRNRSALFQRRKDMALTTTLLTIGDDIQYHSHRSKRSRQDM